MLQGEVLCQLVLIQRVTYLQKKPLIGQKRAAQAQRRLLKAN